MPPLLPFNCIHILALISYVFIAFNVEIRNLIKSIFRDSTMLLIAIGILLLSTVINGTGLFVELLVLPIEAIPICSVFSYFILKNNYDICDIIIGAGVIQAFIAVTAYIVPAFQGFLIILMARNGYDADVMGFMSGWRCFGLSKQLTYAMPVAQSVISCICLYKGIHVSSKYYIPIPFLVLSSMINARTGFVVFIVGVLIILLSGNKVKMTKLFVLTVFSFFAIGLFMSMLSRNENTSEWIFDGVNDISAVLMGKETGDYSYFDAVNTGYSYQVPSELDKLLFGTGKRVQGSKTGFYTDVGFINDIWLGGIFYTIFISLFFMLNSYRWATHLQINVRRRYIIGLGSIVILSLLDLKGQVFSWQEITMLWTVGYCYWKIETKLHSA